LTKDDKFQGFMSKIFEVAKVIEEARVKVKTMAREKKKSGRQ